MLFDPFGSMQGLVSKFGGFMQNPMQALLQRRINIPQSIAGNPQAIMQYMMSNGMLSQQEYSAARMAAQQAQSNPMFQQLLSRR